jgi:antirestriction protein
MTNDTRRVFIAPVAEPVNGAWHDLSDFPDCDALTEAALAAIVRTPDNNMAEELDCSDVEGFGALFTGQHYIGVGEAWAAHMWLEDCDDMGIEPDVALAYASNMGERMPDPSDIANAYIGEYRDATALAEQWIDDGMLGEIPAALVNYIDAQAYGRDLILGGDVWESGGHFFYNR